MFTVNKYIFWLIIAIQLLDLNRLFSQFGYNKILEIENSASLNIDDILYMNHSLYIAGNSFDPNVGLWGTFVANIDTTGHILWSNVLFDSIKQSDLISNTPTRFAIGKRCKIMLLAYNFQLGQNELIITDSLGKELFHNKYITNDLTIFAIDVKEIGSNYFIYGFATRPNYNRDVVVIKTDSLGAQKWIKYYGLPNLDEVFGDVWVNPDNSFTITTSSSKDGWYTQNEIIGSNKPWVFTIDTSGAILNQWIGDFNDNRTNGRGPLYRTTNGDYIIASYDVKEFPGTLVPVRCSPTITRMDSNFNLIWKQNLTSFTDYSDKIQDMAYDSIRDEFIVAGNQRIYYTPDSLGADAWFEKISGEGEIIWNRSDTAIYLGYGKQEHFTAGIAIAPSGSLYVAGWVYSAINHSQGWIMKVTPDGCTDTLCSITSLQDQILAQNKQIFIRPNPVSEKLHLFLSEELKDAEVEIVDLNGATILHQFVEPGENILSFSYPSGLYLYIVRNKNSIISTGKFIRI